MNEEKTMRELLKVSDSVFLQEFESTVFSHDDLSRRLLNFLPKNSLPPSDEEKLKSWLFSVKLNFGDIICRHVKKLDQERSTEVTIAAAIGDVLASIIGGPPALVVSVLIVRYGIDKFCDD